MASNTSVVFGVPKILQKDVECFIVNEFAGEEGGVINTFPSAIPGIVFHHNQGRPAIEQIMTPAGRKFSPPTLFLHGTGSESSVMCFTKGCYSVTRVIFKPHALQSLLGINALALNAAAVGLNEFSGEHLNQQLMDAASAQNRIALLTRFLVASFNPSRRRDELIEESLRLIHHHAGRITVKTLLDDLDISERHFERRFSETVGMSPLSYIRVKRFNEALRLMQGRKHDTLTEVAYALNFHDQSHFIREVKTFTGITPKSLSQKVDELFHNQAGYSYGG